MKFCGFQAVHRLSGGCLPARLVFCSGCPLCLISLLLKETKLGDQWKSGKRSCARVAERQTRWLQVPVSERVWGFKSPLAHAIERAPVLGPGLFLFCSQWEVRNAQLRAEPASRRRELLR